MNWLPVLVIDSFLLWVSIQRFASKLRLECKSRGTSKAIGSGTMRDRYRAARKGLANRSLQCVVDLIRSCLDFCFYLQGSLLITLLQAESDTNGIAVAERLRFACACMARFDDFYICLCFHLVASRSLPCLDLFRSSPFHSSRSLYAAQLFCLL